MKTYLDAMLTYTENNLKQVTTLDHLADHLGFSKYYINTVFSVYTGRSLMSYIRERRLLESLTHLKENLTTSQVADLYGYSSERAYARAVKTCFGHSPSYFKKGDLPVKHPLKIYDLSLNLNKERLLAYHLPGHENVLKRIQEKGIESMKAYLSQVSYVTLGPLTVISSVAVGSDPETEVIDRLKKLASDYKLEVKREFGFDSPVGGHEPLENYRGYEYWLVVDDKTLNQLPSNQFTYEGSDIRVKAIPAYRYASLTIDNPFVDPFERIPAGFRALVSWLDENDFAQPDYQPLKANCLEELIEGDKPCMHIYIPVGH